MLYFEDFMEAIESLPAEVSENLSSVRHLDIQTQNTIEPIGTMIKLFFENCQFSRLSEKEKEIEYLKIIKEYDNALNYSKEKMDITRNLYETYKKVIRKLDSELEKFRMELEADNSGVTSKIEHRIRTLLGRNMSGTNRLDKRRTKFRTGHIFGSNRVISRRRQPYPIDAPERPFFVLKRRFAAFDTSPMSLPPVSSYNGSNQSFLSEDVSNTLISDGANHLSNSDAIHRASSSGSLDSLDHNIEETEFENFHSESQDFCNGGNDLQLSIDSHKRSRILGTPQKMSGTPSDAPGRDSHRAMQGYGSECSPFVSSDNEAAMGMAFSGLAYPCASEQSIDDLLTESRSNTTTINQHQTQYTPRAGSDSPDTSLLQQGGPLKMGLKNDSWLSPGSVDQVRLQAREKRISRTSRRPSRLSSATDSNDEGASSELDVGHHLHYQYLTKPAVFPSSSQTDGEPARKLSMHHIVPSSPAVRLMNMKREMLTTTETDNGGGGGIGEDGEEEQRYCFCHDVSYGDMIACDAPNCPFEWFHYSCVGLLVAPKGQWFCSSCTKAGTAARFASRKRAGHQNNNRR